MRSLLTRTRSPDTKPRRKLIIASMKSSLDVRLANSTASNRNGAHSAIENGQPSTPPNANQKMPIAVFNPPLQFINAAIPSIVVYMAKLDGRKATEALNMPGLKIIAIMKNRAIRGFNTLFTTRNICVWQSAQINARVYRMK